jgi:hypothetical protein
MKMVGIHTGGHAEFDTMTVMTFSGALLPFDDNNYIED